MNTRPLVALTALACTLCARAQDVAASDLLAAPGVAQVASPPRSPSGPAVLAARSAATCAAIPHALAVPEFTPPAPPVVKKVPAMRVDAAVTHRSTQSKSLTVLRGEASSLPDIPTPPAPTPPPIWVLTAEEVAANIYHRKHNLAIGATVYDHHLSTVQWRHPESGVAYEAVCGFDIGLLAGVGQFVHDGESYSLTLTHSEQDREMLRHVTRYRVPAVMPDAILIVQGNPLDPVGTAPITVLRDVIASESVRLVPYQAERRRYQLSAAAWQDVHPPVPRDESYWFKPHRGSRYLQPVTVGGGQ